MKPVIRDALHVWERIFFRVLTGVLCLLILAGIYLSHVGLPWQMGNALMRRIDTGAFAVEAATIRVGLIRGVRLKDVSVYRRSRVGPPAVQAGEVTLWIDPLAFLRGLSTVQRVEVTDGEIRPEFMGAECDPAEAVTLGNYQTELMLTRCQVQGMMIEALQGRLKLSETTARLFDIRTTLSRAGLSGTASGRIQYDCRSAMVDGQVEIAMYPSIVEPILTAWELNGMVRLFQRFAFDDEPPVASLTFEVGAGEGGAVVFNGDVHLRSVRYRGVPVLRADAALSVTSTNFPVVVTLDPLTVVRRDGVMQGRLVIDRALAKVSFDARSSLNPHLLRQSIGVLSDPFWNRWRFEGPVEIKARGVAGYEALAGTDFTMDFVGRDLYYTNHPLEFCTLNMHMLDDSVTLSSVRAGAYGGEVTGGATFALSAQGSSNTAFDVSLCVTNVNFERIATVLIPEDNQAYRGRLSGCFALGGMLGEGNGGTIRGDGTVTIDDGRVFMLPIFGGLSEIMTRIIPGLDFVLRQSDASAAFHVEESCVASEEIKIDGSVLSLKGYGQCGFDKAIDFHAQVKLMKDNNMVAKLVRVVTFPLSKLFEFRVRGTLDEPRWYPENFSTDLLEKIGLKKKSG